MMATGATGQSGGPHHNKQDRTHDLRPYDQDRPIHIQIDGGKERIARHLAEIGQDAAAVDIAALHASKTARYTALMAAGGLRLRDGIAALIDEARTAGVTVAIATTSRPNVDALCAATFAAPTETIFAAIACGDEVAAEKPAPDVYTLALQRLGLPPERAIALEDSANGFFSARAAGLACIVTPSVYNATDRFDGAACVVASVTELGGLDGLARLFAA